MQGERGASAAHTWSGALQGQRLKVLLVGGDLGAVAASYTALLLISGFLRDGGFLPSLLLLSVATAAALWAIRSQGLQLARVSAVRTVELTRLVRVVTLVAVAVVVLDRAAHLGWELRYIVAAAAVALCVLAAWRSAYRAWITAARARGAHPRRLVVIGTDTEARRLIELFQTHAEMGIQVVGVVGDRDKAIANRLAHLWLGPTDDIEQIVDHWQFSGVVMTVGGTTVDQRNRIIRELATHPVHVHLSLGVSGVSSRRLRALPLAHEPMLYVERASLSRSQAVAKRAFDVVASAAILVLATPVLVAAAIAIKLDDPGPVLFRQQRVGRHGRVFGCLKLRSMATDAEQRLAAVAAGGNERTGPLFKLTDDPRVTRVGRFLRRTSIDELPQLFNVLRGEMSLVGPRPALPSEVAQFPEELRARERVLPGITGLWQVEARDNPSFEAYRRLDLFYVENWSLVLDLMIVLATAEHLAARLIGVLIGSTGHGDGRPPHDQLADEPEPDPGVDPDLDLDSGAHPAVR